MSKTAEKTDPKLWNKVKEEVEAGDKGGKPGQWSARKAQLAVHDYKAEGGGYKGEKAADNHLSQWTKEEWGTKSGKKSDDTGERYLPTKAREKMSAEGGHGQDRWPLQDGEGRVGQGAQRSMTGHDPQQTLKEFHEAVNMTSAELKRWLSSTDSHSVGMTKDGGKVTAPGDGEAVGHHMGERIGQIKAARPADLTDDDYADMRKVVGYVHRHMAQKPKSEIEHSRWRYSLMNWGHDPLK